MVFVVSELWQLNVIFSSPTTKDLKNETCSEGPNKNDKQI